MKKIAIITTGLSKVLAGEKCGGGEILIKNLILELKNNPDINLYIFTPDEKELTQKLIKDFPDIKFYIYKKAHTIYAYINEIGEIAQKEKFDKIINYNMILPYKTTVLQCHSFIHKLNKEFFLIRFIKKILLFRLIRAQKSIFKRSNTYSDYIAVSQKIKEDYCNNLNVPEDKIKVIYPGTHIESCKEPIKKSRITLGIVANSSINKGGHYLLLALGILNILKFDFELHIIAPKFNKDILMKFIILIFNLKNKVKVFPFQADMTDFYNNLDVLVVPSQNEAFGLVTLEAMAKGKPAIVSSTAGSSEIITRENGFIFNRSSFFDFLKILKAVITLYDTDFNNYKKMSFRAWETAAKYSWHEFTLKAIDE